MADRRELDTSQLGPIRVDYAAPAVVPGLPLLSFADAVAGGEAMFDRWASLGPNPPPMTRGDTGWADLFRAGYERVRTGKPERVHTSGYAEVRD